MRNYFIGLAIVVVLIIGISVFVSKVIHHKPKTTPTTTQTSKPEKFIDKTTQVSLTADGATVGVESHRAIRITIDNSSRTIDLISGYDDGVYETKTFPNNSSAFSAFLAAINTYGFSSENTNAAKDERGVCPLGIRYVYEATYRSGDPLRSWGSSCKGVNRFIGQGPNIQQLFRNQIPDYNKIVKGVNLTKP